MLRQIVFGGAVSLCNITVHAFAMILLLRIRSIVHAKVPSLPSLRLAGTMIAATSILMAAHLSEVAIWSTSYALIGATAQGTDYLYFAFVNYTTLGYGDIIPVPRWRLLGPMTAMNGVLLFGWSAAVIFHILHTTISRDDFREARD